MEIIIGLLVAVALIYFVYNRKQSKTVSAPAVPYKVEAPAQVVVEAAPAVEVVAEVKETPAEKKPAAKKTKAPAKPKAAKTAKPKAAKTAKPKAAKKPKMVVAK